MQILSFLDRSSVTPGFRAAVDGFLEAPGSNDRIRFNAGCPPIKVERVLTHMLARFPELAIDAVEIVARSGCEYFRGTLDMETADGTRRVDFSWNCKWRADQEGWKDAFGFSDQARAAREYGHDCFERWTEITRPAATPA